MAKLTFRYGAMGSGKTANLLQVAYNYNERGREVAVMKPVIDTKSGMNIDTRIGLNRTADHLISPREDIYKTIAAKFPTVRHIFVDEAQFLTRKHAEQLQQVAVFLDIPVTAYGLRCDGLQESWPGSRRLLEIADCLEEIPTICDCGNNATLNARFLNGQMQLSGPKTVIDDGSTQIVFSCLCPTCYHREKRKMRQNVV